MTAALARNATVLFLALVFTAGLTFATVELPYRLDEALQNRVWTPDGDSHVDTVARLKTELFMAHYHVRAIGYVAFFLLLGLIGLGFSTRRTGLAALGAVGVMLPVFAQFAGVMFFLAGLGMLNAVWLPVLDVSWALQNWGLVVDVPAELLRWLLARVGVHSFWPVPLFFIAGGILVFFLGSWAWLAARARGKGVADLWVYRLSRHPQYLGWILWTYGAYLLLQRGLYPKRSWGIGSSLPWLLSTMVIVGVALVEEVNMRRRHGEAYEAYRRSAPFLFPLPRTVERALAWPFRLFFGKERPDRSREVVAVVGLYTALLVGISAAFYAGGLKAWVTRLSSAEARALQAEALVEEIRGEANWRRQDRLAEQLPPLGEPAVASLVGLLEGDDTGLRVLAARTLGSLPVRGALPALMAALRDADENLRWRAVEALEASGSPQVAPALLPLLDDPAPHIRVATLRALAALQVPEVLERAPDFLGSPESWIRIGGISAVGELGWEEGVPLLCPCLRDESAGVRQEAVLGLLRIGSPRARPALEEALADEDFEVRIYAEETLRRLPNG